METTISQQQNPFTYANLLSELQLLSPEQLQQPVRYWGENKYGTINNCEILSDDYINPSGDGCEPADSYRHTLTEEEIRVEIVYPKDTVLLTVSHT